MEFFWMRLHRGILLSILWTGVALAGSQLARGQDAPSGNLQEHSQPVEPTPIPSPRPKENEKLKPSVEISGEMPSQKKPSPVVKQTPRAEEPATIAGTVEKKTHPKTPATATPQPSATESPVASPMSMSAAKALAISAPLPEYPYQARRANITGSGLCVMLVDTASGKVTSATMAESTGNAILDQATIHTFRRWRFKPGTVSQLRVPISYE